MHAFDPADPGFLADPYPSYAELRAAGPVHDHPGLGLPVAVSHAACSAVLRDRGLGRIWSDAEPAAELASFNLLHRNSLLEREGEPHTRLRRLVASAFARGHTERLAPLVRSRAEALVDDLVRRVRDGEPADLVALVAEPLPVAVIADLLGVPEDRREPLRDWSDAIVRMYEPDPGDDGRAAAERASTAFVALLRELVAERRAGGGGPGGPDGRDLVGDLLAVRGSADESSDRISDDELVGTAVLLLMAGHEATVNVVGNGVYALLRHPEQWQRLLADPSLVGTAVEELIRFDAPLQLFDRTAVTDTTVGGHPVPAGTRIGALLGAAGRDPAVFGDDADRLDVGRSPNPHLGFGAGAHYCLGAPLARLEIAEVLRALVRELPGAAVHGTPVRRPRFVMRGWAELALTG
ncbi:MULTISPECIES: cytochrome P450 [unclassified Pseudonocardia]|uniref:cytochrome P450 n=1 Tax=unclassified Pseudonocardia TaxID=2619320 RepID=UPI0001FFEBB3|nr:MULTISPECIES: cytochrome P450 [unclassified Pseudonocardia]ALE75464.1 cytochrome P450 [Pseudonocardia sp. EC080625-04]ALL74831.1 cytochrome P450 [Pseudonocardia sp. EC080610-09]ALL81854.1 cytochrome P450 [Pseudonocardia sp. EC080619-01]OLM15791.1 putative cytochrome P450 hydroxylase [Pseudonocardia sp. Ae707_Ps1]